MRRADGWLVAALAASAVGLCWHPAWWMTGGFLLAATAVLLDWQRRIRQYDRALEENRRLGARIHEFGNLQGRFVDAVAHEIRTPLGVVLDESDLLVLRCHDATAVRGIAESIAAEVRHLTDRVASFLQIAHPLMRGDAAAHVSVFVGDVVIAAVSRCRALSKKLGVRVVTVLGEPDNGDPSAEVMGDRLLLELMVENLVRNALRLSPPDAQVELTTSADADSVGIVVRDYGIGIPAEEQASVFDWFFDGPARSSATMEAGFGLGIAKRVAEHHRGMITLRDAPGTGCEFVVTLPRCWPVGERSAGVGARRRQEPPVAPG